MVYYIGSQRPLPLIKAQDWKKVDKKEGWELEVVPFSVEELDETNEKVKENFSHPYVYYVGSYQGCGCGFADCVITGDDDVDPTEYDFRASIRSRQLLHDYLKENRIDSLYGCWSGDESVAAENKTDLNLEKILDVEFGFDERTFYTIKANEDEPADSGNG